MNLITDDAPPVTAARNEKKSTLVDKIQEKKAKSVQEKNDGLEDELHLSTSPLQSEQIPIPSVTSVLYPIVDENNQKIKLPLLQKFPANILKIPTRDATVDKKIPPSATYKLSAITARTQNGTMVHLRSATTRRPLIAIKQINNMNVSNMSKSVKIVPLAGTQQQQMAENQVDEKKAPKMWSVNILSKMASKRPSTLNDIAVPGGEKIMKKKS